MTQNERNKKIIQKIVASKKQQQFGGRKSIKFILKKAGIKIKR